MEIIAAEDINSSIDLSPPLSPLAFSLYDSFLSSHCSSCFSLLSQSPSSRHCSAACTLTNPPLLFPPEISPISPSDIRTAIHLLNSTSISFTSLLPHRFGSLLTNHNLIMSDPSFSTAIRKAANFIALPNRKDTLLEEAAICCVLTNAVEVQDSTGLGLGIAVYDSRFSWINHSCSPNACYRFLISTRNNTTSSVQNCPKTLPRMVNDTEKEQVGVCSSTTLCEVGYGPKVITRSIKRIKNGEEITVSYIDLLQPTGLRQSDLWSKYRFLCNCRRCSASPPAYVDSLLEGVLTSEPEETTIDQHHITTNNDEAIKKITDHIEEAIDDFLSDNINPKTCCEELENVLHHGIQIKPDSHPYHLRLHPVHHVALNAYITLATAYKIRSIDSETNKAITEKAFEMRKISAAYSLFLAGVSHHLFSSEPSLAISAAKFWRNAGESLLDLARNFSIESWGESDVKCSKCLMIVTPNSREILRCVTEMLEDVWSWLSRGCPYLLKFKSPVDFRFAGTNGEREGSSEDQRVSVMLLSWHCLVYADLLADLCYGQKSYFVSQNS